MKFQLEFEVGDRVVVNGPHYHDKTGLATGPGVIDGLDPDDKRWHYSVIMDEGDVQLWVEYESLSPEKPLPTPPKFASLEEAEAWLEAHA